MFTLKSAFVKSNYLNSNSVHKYIYKLRHFDNSSSRRLLLRATIAMQIGIYILISERTYFNYLFLGNSHPKTVSETKFVQEKRH